MGIVILIFGREASIASFIIFLYFVGEHLLSGAKSHGCVLPVLGTGEKLAGRAR